MKPSPRLRRERFPYRQLLNIVPIELVEMARYETAMLRARLQQPRVDKRFLERRGLLVNVGSGDRGRPGWVNIDGFRGPGVTIVADVRKHLPLPDESARVVFTEHLLEHLEYQRDARRFLMECLRILEPGGLIRVVVPDGGRYLHAYATGSWAALRVFSPLTRFPAETRMEVINMHFRQGIQHRFSYDAETLTHILLKCGFSDPAERRFGESPMPIAAIDSRDRASESLYVEAIKPTRSNHQPSPSRGDQSAQGA